MSLLNHLLESTIFAAFIGLLTLAFRRNGARTRHWLWMAASVKFLLPFWLLVAVGRHVEWRPESAAAAGKLTFVMEESGPGVVPRTVSATHHQAVAVRPAGRRSESTSQVPALRLVWLAGSAFLLIRWRRNWRSAAGARRDAQPWNPPADVSRLPIPALSSGVISEPGVFGIYRPVLLLPAGIEDRLTAEQIQTILAHEVCHVRRRDNLAAAIHMLVETIFWFHPIVWWLGARLVNERELACDEEVLRTGSDPAVYAEGILAVCQFRLDPPQPCMSGVTGADLKRRIAGILAGNPARPLAFTKKALLAAVFLAAIAGPLAVGFLHSAAARTQDLPATAKPLVFDVASVKVLDSDILWTKPKRSGGTLTWQTQIFYLISYAYHLEYLRISGIPRTGLIYEVEAKTSPDATEDQMRLMLQTLLRDRFKMQAHRETRQMDGYALTIAKGGLKIHPARDSEKPPESMKDWDAVNDVGWFASHIPRPGVAEFNGYRITMPQLADAMQRHLNSPVWDQTGLDGRYFIQMQYALDEAALETTNAPDVFVVLKDKLGLQLEKHKGPVEMLVIDHMETTPTEN